MRVAIIVVWRPKNFPEWNGRKSEVAKRIPRALADARGALDRAGGSGRHVPDRVERRNDRRGHRGQKRDLGLPPPLPSGMFGKGGAGALVGQVAHGGQLLPPKVIRRVDPVYPDLAVQARISAIVILEAEVDERGRVRTVKVLRGHAILDEAAVEAVRQWRYQPLLLNGEPTAFILTVTVAFNLRAPD